MPGITGIAQIALSARDVDDMTRFYRDVVGLRHLFSVPGMSFFDAGGVRLMIAKPERPEFDHPASVIYYRVDDVDRESVALRARGAVVEAEPGMVADLGTHEVWIGFFRDPEQNYFGLMEERQKSSR